MLEQRRAGSTMWRVAVAVVAVAVVAVAVVAFGVAGCSGKPADERAAPAPAPGSAEKVAAPAEVRPATPRALPADFPPECVAYADLIDKLERCDRLGGARDGLTRAYADLRDAWPTVPAERRPEVAAQCKTQAESLHNAAAAACGW